jgi:ubiquinone biosynthesis protein
VPKVFEEFSTKKVLTLEFVNGVKVSNIGKNNSNYDTKRIARIGVDSFFKQILEFGFFHADPHPGNIIILKNNIVCFLDFGMMGHINRDLKNDLIELFVNLIDYNLNGLINKLTDMNLIDEKININLFKNDLIEIMDFYYENELENVELSKILRKLIIVLSKYNISIPRDFLLLSRALILIEGIGRKLDSKINLIEICKPYTKKALKEKFNPKQLQDLVKNNIFEIEHLIKIFPRSLKKSLDKFSEGEIKIDFKHKNLDNISNTLDRAINKLSLAMIISSLIIGFSLIIQKTQDFSFSLFSSVGIFSILGLTASVILGFYLINYILNPKK